MFLMDTSIRKGERAFYGDSIFPYGIARSGFFNKRESDELNNYGNTFQRLISGDLSPENEEESLFIEQVRAPETIQLYAAKLWHKYLEAVQKSKTRHGFIKSESKETIAASILASVEVDDDISSDLSDEL